jgi:hypothetical protein
LILPAEKRAEQASEKISFMAASERTALIQFGVKECTSAPHLLEFKQIEQGDSDLVPGGYVCFLLMNLVSGVSLGDSFWKLDRAERDDIRVAFEAAYK